MRVLLAAAALFALTASASAGPIWFRYTVTPNAWPPTGGAGDLTHGGAHPGPVRVDPAADPSVTILGLWLTPMPPLDDPDWVPGQSNIVSRTTTFQLDFALTDQASGESVGFTQTGVAAGQWMHRWDGLLRPDGAWIEFDGPPARQFALGANVYTVSTAGAYDPFGDGELAASISVRAAPLVHNPEPGTLILGGLGLAAAAGLRLRRRWSTST